MSFLTDKRLGEKAETEFVVLLQWLGIPAVRNLEQKDRDKRGWDIEDLKWGFRYEIKHDVMYQKTGNVYIEHKSLMSCTADFMVYKLGDSFFRIPVIFLLDLVANGDYKEVKGGDQKAPGTLIDGEEFKWLAERIIAPENMVASGQNIKA